MAKGFVDRTNEMVAGRVPCSLPYDVPFTLQSAALSTCTCSAGVTGMPATAAVCASVKKKRFTIPHRHHQHSPFFSPHTGRGELKTHDETPGTHQNSHT